MRTPLQHSFTALALLALVCVPVLAEAQMAPIPQHVADYVMDSGLHSGQEGLTADVYEAYTHTVRVPDAPWLRLQFSDVDLGVGSYLTVTSVQDGAQQRLDPEGIAQWQNTSAYFNGDAVRLTLHVAPGDDNVFVRMRDVVVGEHGAPESQCGPEDNRVSSNDLKAGRVMFNGCTGWLIHDEKVVTAGHCISGASVIQFNVPPSLPGGGVQHPGPEDQYSIDFNSRVWVNGGVGNDWDVFRVFDNTQTGLQPVVAQGGGTFFVRQDLAPPTIRITGYGVDTGVDNQTQQTHTGPNAGSFGTTLAYQVDTTGGNSGSPVIDEATGHAIGVHTHGGCTTANPPGGSNKGTSLFSVAFWNAVGEPPPSCEQSLTATLSDTTPSPGQTVTFDVTVTNNAATAASVDLWLDASGPASRRILFGSGTLPAGATVNRSINLRIPANAPAGSYTFDLHLGDFGADDPCDTVTFDVTMSAPLVPGDGTDTEFRAEVDGGDLFAASATTAPEVTVVPNPFRGQAQVHYTLSATSDVRLAVYDVLGREVVVLVDGPMEAGAHAATFNARGLAAGAYVYRLVAGSEVQVGRLTLTR